MKELIIKNTETLETVSKQYLGKTVYIPYKEQEKLPADVKCTFCEHGYIYGKDGTQVKCPKCKGKQLIGGYRPVFVYKLTEYKILAIEQTKTHDNKPLSSGSICPGYIFYLPGSTLRFRKQATNPEIFICTDLNHFELDKEKAEELLKKLQKDLEK